MQTDLLRKEVALLVKGIFSTMVVLKVLGIGDFSWFWVLFWGFIALNWAFIKAAIRIALKNEK